MVVARALEAVGLNNLPSIDSRIGTQRAVQEIIKNLTVTRPDRSAKILQVDYRRTAPPEEAIRVVGAITATAIKGRSSRTSTRRTTARSSCS